MPADVRVDGDSEDAAAAALDRAARDYERTMSHRLGAPPALDLALLGVGPDGHVCSLFPGHPLLGEERRFVAPVFDSPKPPPWRLTLTLPALAAARLVVVAAFGAAKAPVMREALRDPASRLPVALVLRRAQAALVLLDPAAAQA
jgi:6-phosphogluconolactonase